MHRELDECLNNLFERGVGIGNKRFCGGRRESEGTGDFTTFWEFLVFGVSVDLVKFVFFKTNLEE